MVLRSAHPDITIPDVPLTPYVLQRAEELGDKPALIDGPTGRTVGYAQLAGGVRKAAAGLAARGLRKGDVFAIFCPNIPEFAVAFHDEIPKSASGKILRRVLVEREREGS